MQRLLVLFLVLAGVQALRAETVLVIPFFNQSKSANLDWIGESIAETVRESLDSEGVLALGREERLEAFRRLSLRSNAILTEASIIKAGESLDASKVIYGNYDLTGETLHITARLLNLKRLKQEPDFGDQGPLEDLATLEARVSWQAIASIEPKTAPSEPDFLKARPHVRLDALENYIRGLLAPTPEQQHRFFSQAARLDANYSQPCFQLGKWYWQKKDYRVAAGWLERVNRADSHYLEAQFFLGLSKYFTNDYAVAAQHFETVAATVPLNEVFNDLGAAQTHSNLPAAIDSFRKAVEGDSADPDFHFNLARTLWKAGRFQDAAQSFRAVLERNPNDEEAAALLIHAEKQEPPRPGSDGHARIKTNYEETAFRQLKAELESKK